MVTVQDLAFEENRAAEPVSLPQKALGAVAGQPLLIKYLALLAGMVLVLFFGVRPALQTAQRALHAGATAGEIGAVHDLHGQPLDSGGAHAPLPPLPDPERLRSQEIFDQVTGHLKREPTQSSRLLQSWIHSE